MTHARTSPVTGEPKERTEWSTCRYGTRRLQRYHEIFSARTSKASLKQGHERRMARSCYAAEVVLIPTTASSSCSTASHAALRSQDEGAIIHTLRAAAVICLHCTPYHIRGLSS